MTATPTDRKSGNSHKNASKNNSDTLPDPAVFAANMALAMEKTQRILQEMLARRAQDMATAPFDPLNITSAFMELFSRLASDPVTLWEKQAALWQGYAQLWQHAAQAMLGEEQQPLIVPDSKDRRFRDAAWQENIVFDFLKQSYLLMARWLQQASSGVEGLDAQTARKIEFYTRQFADALSPSNFLLTNPEALKAMLASNAGNLVNGLDNMLEDLERGNGSLRIRMTDMGAFTVGKNLGVTPGKVVYQNELIQLIQYAPRTKEVYRTPLLLVPAWINKFYILDLQQENSLVNWLVGQGHTVFVISWVNPDERLSGKGFDDYMREGPLAAMEAIEQATGERQISVMAYCLGGTLLSITLAWLHAKQRQDRIKSITYLTTMVDFSEAGELAVFIDDEQLAQMEARMAHTGYLDGSDMALTFNMLRANDLIWSFVVNNYLLGKSPFPFDLLYWNSDTTRMPAAMHGFYLRNMYQRNLLAKPGGITIDGVKIDLSTIATPSYILSTREDHIAPWKSTYAATQLYKGDIRFVLAASGHIAGVINPPGKKKYSHWVSEAPDKQSAKSVFPASPDQWLETAREETGSWWPDWQAWQQRHTGAKVAARTIGDGKLKPIEDAPGSFVTVMV